MKRLLKLKEAAKLDKLRETTQDSVRLHEKGLQAAVKCWLAVLIYTISLKISYDVDIFLSG